MEIVDLILCLREAFRVERCHTIPHHGSYTNGQHTCDALALLFALHPDPSPRLVKALLFHDVPERWTGDVPAPAKWTPENISPLLGAMESRCLEALGVPSGSGLDDEEAAWFYAVDKLEMILWCHDQVAMGNMSALPAIEVLTKRALENPKTPAAVLGVLTSYRWKRSSDLIPGGTTPNTEPRPAEVPPCDLPF